MAEARNPTSSRALRRRLVAELEAKGALRSPAVRRAFLGVAREWFVPEVAARDGLARVYADQALVTRTGPGGVPTSSSSQPAIMAQMLERLELRPGMRVLEIGAGTGYNAALLATIVGPGGHVTTVDVEPELVAKAGAALRDAGFGHVRVVVADARTAVPGDGPYDRIILTASSDHVPRVWFDHLAPDGLLELPLRLGRPGGWEQLVVTLRKEPPAWPNAVGDRLSSVSVVWGGFMPLRSPHDGPPAERPTQVSVAETIDGQYRVVGEVRGAGLAAMTADARRRLVEVLLTVPRVRAVATPEPSGLSLVSFVAYAEPPSGVAVGYTRSVTHAMEWGAGVASEDGRSLAVLVGGSSAPPRARFESYGGTEADAALRRVITQWRRAGRPRLDDWRIEVPFGDHPEEGRPVVILPGGVRSFRRPRMGS